MTTVELGGVQEARCAYHVDRIAVGTCDRCGSFYCSSCVKQLAHKRLCSACLALPGIDYLAELRNKAWGKRDGWVWYLGGLFGFVTVTGTVANAVAGNLWAALFSAAAAALSISYLMLLPWSRVAIFGLIPVSIALAIVEAPAVGSQTAAYAAGYSAGAGVGRGLVMLLFLLAAYRSARNKLAFKLDVSDAELARYHDRYLSNSHASRAFAYGLLSLPIPLLIPIAWFFGIAGYRKVNPNAWPPVGRRGLAIAGLACAGVSTLLWSVVLVSLFIR